MASSPLQASAPSDPPPATDGFERPFFLALDAGTSSVKAALFDSRGRQVGVHAEEYVLERPRADWVELDPELYWQAAQTAIGAVLQRSGADPDVIPALGVTSQGETLIALDREGRPLRKAIVWLDNRAGEEARQVAAAFDPQEVYRITGQPGIVPCWTACKILWLRNHEPGVFARAARFLLVQDYLVHRLTGRFVSDHGLNPSTLYYDLLAGDWWAPMLAFLGISRAQLPELVQAGTPVGPVTARIGLSPRTQVVTAPIDQVAGAVGAGNLAPGRVTETTGSALALCATCATPRTDPQRRIGLYRHATPATYALLPWVPAAGLLLRWFRDAFGEGRSFAELDREAATVPPGADGLLLLPHLNGAFSPDVNPAARGVFHGVTLAHGRAHFTRAILEAVAFLLLDQLDLLAALGVPAERVCALGGGAHSPLWLQIKADVLGREVVTVDTDEVTALGVAVLAAAGAGLYASPTEAAARMVRLRGHFTPNPALAGVYAEGVRSYRRLNRLLIPTFGEPA